jgi:hypothetical protein
MQLHVILITCLWKQLSLFCPESTVASYMRYCSIVQARWMIRTNLSPVSSTYSVNATHELLRNVDEKRPSIFFWVRHVILLTTVVSAVLFFAHPKSPMFGFREFAG